MWFEQFDSMRKLFLNPALYANHIKFASMFASDDEFNNYCLKDKEILMMSINKGKLSCFDVISIFIDRNASKDHVDYAKALTIQTNNGDNTNGY